jgi:phosphate-selective porin OprO and OprP
MSTDRRRKRKPALVAGLLLAAALLLAPGLARGQDAVPADEEGSSLDDTLEAGEAESEPPARQLVRWNQYEGPRFTIRVGAGFLYEGAAYGQDDESKQQFGLAADTKIRDSRLLLNGTFPARDRKVTWTAGIMYDSAVDDWFVRQTGIMVDVPEISGKIWVGRAKEGISMSKIMNGYSGFTMERAAVNDIIPILADGVKWLGLNKERHLIWNVGYFGDWLSEGEGFSTYEQQAVARLVWLPIAREADKTLLHLGVALRWAEPKDGKLKIRSRPEVNEAPFFLDTGTFATDETRTIGVETYYRPGPWVFGMEYLVHEASTPGDDPVFHGGEVVVAWNITGETRGYNTVGGFFKAVSPEQSVFSGGPGAWELVARLSYTDYEDKGLPGGKFWRITPMVNWHLSDNARLEMVYGYGVLDRFELEGATHFFQSRLQLQF